MSMYYFIKWRSKVNGRDGRGTRLFSREEAEQLVKELNSEYPNIEHQSVAVAPPVLQTTPPETQAAPVLPEPPVERQELWRP